jgi:hypothetical protein
MIEQTELVISKWIYTPPSITEGVKETMTSTIEFDVMRKRVSTKKGIACRFSCTFERGGNTILDYVGEDSYVIDLEDKIDRTELLKMINNSYSKFTDKFELKKLSTILHSNSLKPLNESLINVDAILPMLE